MTSEKTNVDEKTSQVHVFLIWLILLKNTDILYYIVTQPNKLWYHLGWVIDKDMTSNSNSLIWYFHGKI